MSTGAWRNWAGNQVAHPVAVHRPTSEHDLAAVVKQAAAEGARVKVVGSGHSFTDIACTDGHLVDLGGYNRVLSIDPEARTATVQAGIRLEDLNRHLDLRGLAMPNLGDIAYQTISGAVSTSTHGTGRTLTGLAGQIAALRLVLGDGTCVDCSPEEESELFHCARVGLGALGIISTVTLDVVPAFNLAVVEEPMRVDSLLEDLDTHVDGNDHFEFFWVPHTGWALTKRNNRTDEPLAPRGRVSEWWNDRFLQNYAFGALCRVGRLRPQWIPRLAKALPAAGRVTYVDQSYRVFASPRLVHFYEMEYAVPRAAGAGGPQPDPAVRGRLRPAPQLPGRGALHGPGRHPAVDGQRAGVVLPRRPRVPGHGLGAVLRRGRSHRDGPRRATALGQAPHPDRGLAGRAVSAVGAIRGGPRPGGPRPPLRQRLPGAGAGTLSCRRLGRQAGSHSWASRSPLKCSVWLCE